MSKKLQIILNEESWNMVDQLIKESNENFDGGTINYSDAINEMILSSKVDVRALQLKHTDWRRSLRALASKGEVDLEQAIKALSELKAKTVKRKSTSNLEEPLA